MIEGWSLAYGNFSSIAIFTNLLSIIVCSVRRISTVDRPRVQLASNLLIKGQLFLHCVQFQSRLFLLTYHSVSSNSIPKEISRLYIKIAFIAADNPALVVTVYSVASLPPIILPYPCRISTGSQVRSTVNDRTSYVYTSLVSFDFVNQGSTYALSSEIPKSKCLRLKGVQGFYWNYRGTREHSVLCIVCIATCANT